MSKILDAQMKTLISNYTLGSVATVNDDGTPAVSPKGTFVILNDTSVAFGEIRSPQTMHNLRARPAIEVNFMDVLARRAVRLKGNGIVIEKDSERGKIVASAFEANWPDYIKHMQHFVVIEISQASLLVSPAYDIGLSEQELTQTNLDKMKKYADNSSD